MTQYTMLDKCRKVKQEFECTFFVSPKEILMTKEDRDKLVDELKEMLIYKSDGQFSENGNILGMEIVIVDSYGPQARIGR